MSEPLREDQLVHLAERLRGLLNDCWDAGVFVVHEAQMDGHCQGDYALRAHDGTGAVIVAEVGVRWYPMVERWGVA